MADNKPLEVQEKKELVAKGEKTVPARYYMPNTDIRETEDALLVVMEVPGVDRENIDIKVEEDTLRVEARIDTTKYDGMKTITRVYDSYAQARAAVDAVEKAGVPSSDVSIVANKYVSAEHTDVDDVSDAAKGAGIGGALGGGAGLLAGLGLLAIPGLGPVVAAGWLAATAVGAAAGAATGGIVGALVDAGVDREHVPGHTALASTAVA